MIFCEEVVLLFLSFSTVSFVTISSFLEAPVFDSSFLVGDFLT